MFRSRTLFVVGAGASCEFGFPSGAQIKDTIAHLLDIRFEDGYSLSSGDRQIVECFTRIARDDAQLQGNINPFLDKCWLVRDALPAAISIDNLLHAHQGDVYVELAAKLGIVKAILEAERKSSLHPGDTHPPSIQLDRVSNTWLMQFFKMASEGITKVGVTSIFENVSIICFNYDRCIEWFIPQALQTYYGIDAASARDVFQHLKVLHPYGTVGSIDALPYGSKQADIISAAKSIFTFSEGLADQTFMRSIRAEVEEAETIVFLGFAFHPMNMALLTPGGQTDAARVFATSFGLSDADEAVIEDAILEMLQKERVETSSYGSLDINPSHVPKFAKLTCAGFFENFFRSISAAA